jgi:hypothetical protein
VSIADGLPLVPLPQLLARGASVFVGAFPIFALGVPAMLLFLYLVSRAAHEVAARARGRKNRQLRREAARLAIPILILAFLLLQMPWPFVVGLSVVACSSPLALPYLRQGWQSWYRVIAIGVLSYFPTLLVTSFLYPQPLPTVELRAAAACIKGALIADTGSVWYVVVRPHEIRAVDHDAVSRSRIISQPPRDAPSLFQTITNHRAPLDLLKKSYTSARGPTICGTQTDSAQFLRHPVAPLTTRRRSGTRG